MTTGHTHVPSRSRRGFAYNSMIQRVRAILAYLYDNFLDNYDYFHFAGDDVYIIMENLKEFLSSERVRRWEDAPNRYFFGGFWMNWPLMKIPEGEFYLGGGSGYTMSRKSLKAYAEGPLQACSPHQEGAMEDVFFSKCVFANLTREFADTRDESGAHRYHQMPVWAHVNHPKTNYGGYMRSVEKSYEHMHRVFGFPIRHGMASVSNSSIAFHRHDPTQLRRYEMLLYRDLTAECS